MGEGQPQHLPGEPSRRLAQARVERIRVRRTDGPAEDFCAVGNGAQADDGRVFLTCLIITLHDWKAQVRKQGMHHGLVHGCQVVQACGVEFGEGSKSEIHFYSTEYTKVSRKKTSCFFVSFVDESTPTRGSGMVPLRGRRKRAGAS